MKVTVRRCRQGINRHEDSLSAVERAKHLFTELWTRSDIAVGSTEASARCLWLLLRSWFEVEGKLSPGKQCTEYRTEDYYCSR